MWLSRTPAVAVSARRHVAGMSQQAWSSCAMSATRVRRGAGWIGVGSPAASQITQQTWFNFHRHYSTIDNSWTRTETVPFPKVWRHCSGKMKLADSTVTQFRVQDVPEDLFDDAIDFMTTEMINDEPMFASLGVGKDTTSLRELQGIWRQMLQQRVSLAVLVDDEQSGRPKVAGCNILGVVSKDCEATHQEVHGEALRRLLAALDHMDQRTNVFSRYSVSHYLTGLGMCISRDYRDQGLGKELLHARLDMCRALRLPLTVTLFSGPVSQSLAHTLGMDLLVNLPYEQYTPGGKAGFPGVKGAMQLMAKKIP